MGDAEQSYLQTCPVCTCKLVVQSACPRCGSDLSLLRNIQSQSRNQLFAALTHLNNGNTNRAYQCLERAKSLSNDALTQSVMQLISLQLKPEFHFQDNIKSRIFTWIKHVIRVTTSQCLQFANNVYDKFYG